MWNRRPAGFAKVCWWPPPTWMRAGVVVMNRAQKAQARRRPGSSVGSGRIAGLVVVDAAAPGPSRISTTRSRAAATMRLFEEPVSRRLGQPEARDEAHRIDEERHPGRGKGQPGRRTG